MHTDQPRRTVLVSGAPGSGKSTLARPLADQLGFSLLSKDHIKETLYDAFNGPPNDFAFSRQTGGAAMELLWTLATRCPQVVLEANFRPYSDYERARIASLQGPITEVYCRCPPEETARRFKLRAQAEGHHRAHPLRELSPEMLGEFDKPVGIGTVIEVDTTRPVDVKALVGRLRGMWVKG